MLKFCSLYSGSSGNSLFIQNNSTKILIDTGMSIKKIEEALSSINSSLEEIEAILITHEHSDHIKSLGNISKKYHIPVYANQETWDAMPKEKEKILSSLQNFFKIDTEFKIGDLKIFPFSIPHDAANPCGFNICYENHKISIATDLGHVDSKIMKYLENSSFVMLEANYDPEVLKCCSYPYLLKTRIAGPNGHLSNNTAGKIVSTLINSGLKSVMLGHLSKESNFPELAHKTVLEELAFHHLAENAIDIQVASRVEPSKLIEVC